MQLSARKNYNAHIIINHKLLCENYNFLRKKAGAAKVAAVLKANAYGLGVNPIALSLYKQGCRDFFIANFSEAIELRELLSEDCAIYLLNGPAPENIPNYIDKKIVPVINQLFQLQEWLTFAKANNIKLSVVLHIDTGMNRLGLTFSDLCDLVKSEDIQEYLDILYIMSHLSQSGTPEAESNHYQLTLFDNITSELFNNCPQSISNSHALFLEDNFHKNLVRCGISLYGLTSCEQAQQHLKAIVQVKACIIQIRDVPANQPIGYNQTFITDKPRRIATLALGYGNGLPRILSNKGAFYYQDTRLPIVGNISMDLTTIDISDLDEDAIKLYDWVDLISDNQDWEKVAEQANTITYELLTSLGKGCERLHQL